MNGVRTSPPALGMIALRIGLGALWAVNLAYILLPANDFFPTFASTAASFGPTSLGGPGLASFAVSHAQFVAVGIAIVTGYLAVAFLLGLTTRVACAVGAVFNVVLLITQFGTITQIPGATDVGPQPLYLLIYGTLFVGFGDGAFSLDGWLARAGRTLRAVPNPPASGESTAPRPMAEGG